MGRKVSTVFNPKDALMVMADLSKARIAVEKVAPKVEP